MRVFNMQVGRLCVLAVRLAPRTLPDWRCGAAGITRPQPLDQITERDWDEMLTVDLKSVFLVTQTVLPGMGVAQY